MIISMLLGLIYMCWVIRIVANISSFIHLWYVKEYRLDRMWIHMHTSQGKRLLVLPFRQPPLLPKTSVLFVLTIVAEIFIVFGLPFEFWIRFIIADLISFPITILFVVFLKIPTWTYHTMRIYQAKATLAQHKNLLVIGITGSYGKTSTKEFLATILSSKFNVLKTQASKNSAIGISEVILDSLMQTHKFFVVEMGAYKRGEIAQMTNFVKPEIGIITAINEQHQDLFGSIETTMKAKYELIQGLVGKQIAIFNGDNEKTMEMATWAKRDGFSVWLYSVHKFSLASHKKELGNYVYASDISSSKDDVIFTVHFESKTRKARVGVMGEHHVSNILAAITASLASGMNFDDAVGAVGAIVPSDKTLQIVSGPNHSILINDTFNNNPDAAVAAIKYLEKYSGKKFIVFQPMIELGSYSAGAHEAVGKIAGQIGDFIILTNKNFFESFLKGVQSSSLTKHVYVYSPHQAATFIRSHVAKDDAVLFKGKEAELVLKNLHS